MDKRKHVALVVDDEPLARNVVRRILERYNWSVVEARDGGEALRFATGQPIDILVTDFEMPVLDGIQLAKALRMILPNLKVLYLSGYAGLFRSSSTLKPGEAFLDKPYSTQLFTQTVTQLLESPAR